MRSKLGICQWFHYEDYVGVEQTVARLHDLGVRHLRTGISWADYYRPGGKAWYDWQMRALADFEILLSIWHTPPSISEGNSCSSPPKRLKDYADFIDLILSSYGHQFETLELWNEPNNCYKWDFVRYDPNWLKFAQMISLASHWAKRCGKRTVLGGMIPVDHEWLNLLRKHEALGAIDVIAIHAFPEMWWPEQPNWEWFGHWQGWDKKVAYIAEHAGDCPIWVTETGLATWDLDRSREGREELQIMKLEEAAAAPVDRVYWYCLTDLDPAREAIEGFHVDENEYHMGLVRFDGTLKPAYAKFKELLAQSSTQQSDAVSSSTCATAELRNLETALFQRDRER